jgi:hypothetical protein
MTRHLDHKILITTGCLLWIFSFFGEVAGLQPFSTIGVIVSPILTIWGLYFWFRFYKSTRGHFPKFWTVFMENIRMMSKNPFAGIGFMLKHIFETWTFIIIFWMGIVLIGFLTFGQSDCFQTTKEYCKNNKEILSQTGSIKYFGILVSGGITTHGEEGDANLSFTIIGTKGNFSANSELSRFNGEWTVENLTIR